MRATPAQTKSAAQAAGERESDPAIAVLNAMLERISAERAACEQLPDPELAQRAGRKLLTAVACAADAVLADANMLQSAPDKLAAFYDKSAAACVAAIEGLHKRAMLAEAVGAFAPGPRATDPRRDDFALWGPPKTS
jgi:hypothetical protein